MSKAARQRTARERLAEERKKQALKEKRTRALMISLSAVAILALAVGIGVYYANKKEAGAYSGSLAPASRDTDGSIVMAAQGVSTPTLEIFEDFQCPICKEFEQASGSTIKKLAVAGKVKVVYRPFQLFTQEPLASNSRRAASAALCAPADKWVLYHDALYKNQPKEGTKGFSVKDLTSWAKQAGISDPAFEKCVTGNQKSTQLDTMTKYALNDRKVTGTPTVYLNGRSLNLESQVMDPQALETAILAAKTSPAATATTPAPSGSATPKK